VVIEKGFATFWTILSLAHLAALFLFDSFGNSCRDKPDISDVQGDQIGRIFPNRVTVYFGQLIENYKNSLHFYATSLQFHLGSKL
jgi:hypothetical protein